MHALLLLDAVGCVRLEILVFTVVDALVVLNGGADAAFDCDCVFLSDASALTVNSASSRCRFRFRFAFATV